MKKKIYVADDEPNIRDLIVSFLLNEGFEARSFENGDTLLEAFLKDAADMVILDIMMPGTDGLSLCARLREKSNVPIIIVSARDSELDRITGITMGSDDYLVKPFSPLELVARVKAIFRRLSYDTVNTRAESNVLFCGNISIDTGLRQAEVSGTKIDLTPTETALLIYMFQNKDRAVSREELLKNVWKFDFDADTRATDDVIKRLRKKLNTSGSTAEIESVWGFGFRMVEHENKEH